MSMAVHVFFGGRVPGKAALARTLKELGFPFTISDPKGSLAQQSGYTPMKLRGEETGVEFNLHNDRNAVAEFVGYGLDPNYDKRASFRWGGNAQEGAAALCSAAALAQLTGGVVFDESEAKLLTIPEAIAAARAFLHTLPKSDRRSGTRPADIKRILKPLLELRSDLVLRGRLLLIRPVRHIIRGAVFARTGDKYTLSIGPCLQLLHEASWDRSDLDASTEFRCEIWQPYFAPALFDYLAEDVFTSLAAIGSLADLAQSLQGTPHFGSRLKALVLSGQMDRATAFLAELEKQPNPDERERAYVQELRTLLQRDISSICTEYHAKEANSAHQLGILDIWEPSLFPAEVSDKARQSHSNEVAFPQTPWVTIAPSFVEQPPDDVGDMRFSNAVQRGRRGVRLVATLTREQAQDKHRNREHYVLAARLPEGQLVILIHDTHWSPHDPDRSKNLAYSPLRHLNLWFYCTTALMLAQFRETSDRLDMLEFHRMDVRKPDNSGTLWLAYNQLEEKQKTIYDRRIDPRRGQESRPMSEAEIELCQFECPPTGEVDDILRRVTAYLENEGFGAFPR